jgi:chitin synthase
MQKNSLQLEPIGVMFVAVFAVIIVIQFTAMLVHRFGTFMHILASTIIDMCTKDVQSIAKEQALEKDGLQLVRKLHKVKSTEGEY